MLTLQSISRALGGQVSGREVLCPTPGHSKRDRGTAIRIAEGAPDGLLVTCYNGGMTEALMVKDALRAAGILTAYNGTRRELTEAEKAAIKRAEAEREREKAEAQANAAELARQRLAQAMPADPAHEYLVRKRIAPERLWQAAGLLLVPMNDEAGTVWSLQTIAPDGTKRFAKGGRTKGLFWWAGKAIDRLVIGEGMATVAAVRRATSLPVVAAMSADNVPTIARMIRARRPDLHLTIAADDDATGVAAARQAAAETGAALALPEIAP
ncbi:MAG: toprim domain-containing protein [Alphaproteobacteria bacterium]|nr:toprim domain-containing protein [Alphaproteobacteria bacterium]